MADRSVLLCWSSVSLFGCWGVVVVFWLLRSMPTPGPGDTATGTLPTRFELLEENHFDDLKYESYSKR